MKIQINITKDILKKSMYCGQYKSAQNCTIACAIVNLFGKRALVNNKEIMLTKDNSDIYNLVDEFKMIDIRKNNNNLLFIKLPEKAKEFIEKFDNIKPGSIKRAELPEFSFEIDVPEEIINEISIDEVYNIIKNTPSLDLVEAN